MEKWDLYDINFNKLPKTAVRGDELSDDEHHLVVNAWIVNDKNQFLITQRCKDKPHALMWECTGGSAVAGESDINACVREIKEEVGIDIDISSAKFLGMERRYYKGCPDLLRVYIFKDNTPLENVKIQVEEVSDAMWADKETIKQMVENGTFMANPFLEKALDFYE